MKGRFIVALVLLLVACHTDSMLVYSSGFSFSRYEYVVVAKPEGPGTSSSLYGMDVELANLLTQYNMKVLGNKEYESLSADDKGKTLFARMAISASKKKIDVTVSFDDMVTGRTGASVTTYASGDLFDSDSRTEAFADAAKAIINAFEHDKGLTVSESTDKKQHPRT